VREPGNSAGNAHADRRVAMQFVLDEFDTFLDRAHGAVIIMPWSWHAVAVKFAAIGLKGDEFDFCARQDRCRCEVLEWTETLKGRS